MEVREFYLNDVRGSVHTTRKVTIPPFSTIGVLQWPCMAAQVKDHIGQCGPCLTFKVKQPKAPLEVIMATHPLELVHLNYLCLKPRKGLEENVLVVTDHFTQYAQVYVTRNLTTTKTTWASSLFIMGYPKRSCWIKVETLKVSWWLISVH